ncbi:porin family protein [Paraflavitalea soli]|uniref:Porin family protein n=1 Tax=Paraflavitalea soli TaxID=2315862 RepID=A0A3B7MPK2_9BACT|nr:porin family protein [Paraflavitalea soli]AXY75243.1 porin family protein [Paraflavitalea soli]
MYPLNDNDLDRMSREAADQFDVEQNTSGWEALENRLNRELPLKEDKERRRFLFWLFLIVLLAGGGLLWTMTGKRSDTNLAVTGTNTVPSANNNQNNNEPVTPASTSGVHTEQAAPTTIPTTTADAQHQATPGSTQTDDNSSTTPASGNPASTARVPAKEPGTAAENNNNKSSATTIKQQTIAGNKKNKEQPIRSAIAKTSSARKGKQGLASQSSFRENNPLPIPEETTQQGREPKASIVSWNGIKAGAIGSINAPKLTIAPDSNAGPGQKTASKKKDNKQNKGFEIGLVAGPDMSNVKFTDMDKAGYNAGLQIGYRFSNRWSVNTGLLYTRKNYTADGKDWTKTGWLRNTDLHSVWGYCKMFEIPLNVRYDFSVNKKQRWFASAGASTYIMTGESYAYDYTYNGNRMQTPMWDRDSTSNYPFSILNLSGGFERALNKRFSLQAEPYLKIPMKGLGYGKLDLTSYGIYFSVKYRFYK